MMKTGLSYFSFDCDFDSDTAIRRLVARCGMSAKLCFIETCRHAYKDYGYYLPLDDAELEIIAYDCGLEIDAYKDILKNMIDVGLFIERMLNGEAVITSKRMQKMYRNVRDYKAFIADELKIDDFDALPDKCGQNGDKCGQNAKKPAEIAAGEEYLRTSAEKCPTKVKESKVKESKEEQRDIVEQVVSYLNTKTGKQFKPSSADTKRHIVARINDGYALADFKAVVDIKTLQWLNDKKMAPYLRPSTLFGTKMESYLNETNTTEVKRYGYDIPQFDLGAIGGD